MIHLLEPDDVAIFPSIEAANFKVTNGFFSSPSVSNGKIYIVDKNLRVLSFN